MVDKTDGCELCELNSGIFHLDCLGCVVRKALDFQKDHRRGFMDNASRKGKHSIETIEAAIVLEYERRKQQDGKKNSRKIT